MRIQNATFLTPQCLARSIYSSWLRLTASGLAPSKQLVGVASRAVQTEHRFGLSVFPLSIIAVRIELSEQITKLAGLEETSEHRP